MTTGDGFALRPAAVGDSVAMAAIHAASFPASEHWSADVFQLQLALPNVLGLTDLTDGLILIRIAGDEAEVLTLAVRPQARRRGLGSALLEKALAQVAAAGISVVFLEASIKNTAAVALYREFGFTEAGLRKRYYSDGTDAHVLRLDLPLDALSSTFRRSRCAPDQ